MHRRSKITLNRLGWTLAAVLALCGQTGFSSSLGPCAEGRLAQKILTEQAVPELREVMGPPSEGPDLKIPAVEDMNTMLVPHQHRAVPPAGYLSPHLAYQIEAGSYDGLSNAGATFIGIRSELLKVAHAIAASEGGKWHGDSNRQVVEQMTAQLEPQYKRSFQTPQNELAGLWRVRFQISCPQPALRTSTGEAIFKMRLVSGASMDIRPVAVTQILKLE